MAAGADDIYVATRRQLHQVAESMIAGPQHRSAGTIRLAVRPDGFTAVAMALAVRGIDLVFGTDSVPLAGRAAEIAAAAVVEVGAPDGVYRVVDPLTPDTELKLDPTAAEWLSRAHYAGGHALKHVLPEAHPVLWPEHFDVAATQDEVNYGVSAGDQTHSTPYAYVGPWQQRSGPFWNASFGALLPLDPDHDIDALTAEIADFFERGRRELTQRP